MEDHFEEAHRLLASCMEAGAKAAASGRPAVIEGVVGSAEFANSVAIAET